MVALNFTALPLELELNTPNLGVTMHIVDQWWLGVLQTLKSKPNYVELSADQAEHMKLTVWHQMYPDRPILPEPEPAELLNHKSLDDRMIEARSRAYDQHEATKTKRGPVAGCKSTQKKNNPELLALKNKWHELIEQKRLISLEIDKTRIELTILKNKIYGENPNV